MRELSSMLDLLSLELDTSRQTYKEPYLSEDERDIVRTMAIIDASISLARIRNQLNALNQHAEEFVGMQ